MSKATPVLVALVCSLLAFEAAAAPAKAAAAPKASEAQLLAGLLASIRLAEGELMQTYRENPRPEVVSEFIAATGRTLERMDREGWRKEWGSDSQCPDGSIHCASCGCSGRGTMSNPPMCRKSLPRFEGELKTEQGDALLRETFGMLETDVLQRFMHGPRLAVVNSMIDEVNTTVKEVTGKYAKKK